MSACKAMQLRFEFGPVKMDATALYDSLPPFTREGYRRLIGRFLDAGYVPTIFADVCPAHRDLVIRHDIDLSLEAAVRIAELEHEMGVRATYFVMVSSGFYNVFSPDGTRLLNRIAALGHAIGLHFDITTYPTSSLVACSPAIATEFRLLATAIGNPIDLISLHNPPAELVNRESPVGCVPHTYEPRFISDIAYVSESGGRWRYGGPFDRPAFKNGTAFHLLVHPIWWAEDQPTDRPELVLEAFALQHGRNTRELLSRGFRAYREYLHAGDHG